MKTWRRQAREVAFQFIYQRDLGRVSDAPHTVTEIETHFNHFKVPAEVREFATFLIHGTFNRKNEIDSKIEGTTQNWRLDRMPAVDRSLLRMAVFELLNATEAPPAVIINEAIEIGKAFGTEDTSAFLNGILDAISKNTGENPA